jgi:hypothetical protein
LQAAATRTEAPLGFSGSRQTRGLWTGISTKRSEAASATTCNERPPTAATAGPAQRPTARRSIQALADPAQAPPPTLSRLLLEAPALAVFPDADPRQPAATQRSRLGLPAELLLACRRSLDCEAAETVVVAAHTSPVRAPLEPMAPGLAAVVVVLVAWIPA